MIERFVIDYHEIKIDKDPKNNIYKLVRIVSDLRYELDELKRKVEERA